MEVGLLLLFSFVGCCVLCGYFALKLLSELFPLDRYGDDD